MTSVQFRTILMRYCILPKSPNHTSNRLFEEYTVLRQLSEPEATIVFASFSEAADKLGDPERDDLDDLLRQVIVLQGEVLVPVPLLARHAAHLGYRSSQKGYLFSEANIAAMGVINAVERHEITGPEARSRALAYWLSGNGEPHDESAHAGDA